MLRVKRRERDLWIEMSIREIATQGHFADLSFGNIGSKAEQSTDITFSSIHSFLSHCAMISKLLNASGFDAPRTTIGDILGVSRGSFIHNRNPRNHLEHYDERLKHWINSRGTNITVADYNMGPKHKINAPDTIFVRHYDPDRNIFTFVDTDFDLGELHIAAIGVKNEANRWVREVEDNVRRPPFG